MNEPLTPASTRTQDPKTSSTQHVPTVVITISKPQVRAIAPRPDMRLVRRICTDPDHDVVAQAMVSSGIVTTDEWGAANWAGYTPRDDLKLKVISDTKGKKGISTYDPIKEFLNHARQRKGFSGESCSKENPMDKEDAEEMGKKPRLNPLLQPYVRNFSILPKPYRTGTQPLRPKSTPPQLRPKSTPPQDLSDKHTHNHPHKDQCKQEREHSYSKLDQTMLPKIISAGKLFVYTNRDRNMGTSKEY